MTDVMTEEHAAQAEAEAAALGVLDGQLLLQLSDRACSEGLQLTGEGGLMEFTLAAAAE